ncbi:uncharacterized protein LOC126776415 isoform X2 [Nymphalis io]|uniref:uncharacterized protein LOC126776415 isoform X2 n=1 Tax=Inachis io TaxID=171585 RepID=UPI0021679802|nr:uncharacterized protein LOC126776415 isoform X2 [Nymphalis io]
MRPFTLGAVFLSLVIISYQAYVEKSDKLLGNPMESDHMRIRRTSDNNRQSDFNQFVEDKLIQHTQALEHLVNLVQRNEDTIKQLVNTLTRKVAKPIPKLPEKLYVHQTRRSGGESDKDPISRQPVTSKPMFVPNAQAVKDKPSPWCSVAVLCERTMDTVCGYDDNFGYGKFEDICHMLQVNCYWKYNFAFVPSCKPIL